ncbi:uncharacterized protein LOC130994235 [Salvia miltiorrhiza]|uniref:uncharacterized protein LOC130994235 n=1 Tax=Salvia miltiorrhiza TaxID=226208 RepID=UPI0025AD4AC4|nr:uncharacterized protein LOC130994235 [Salvia miltiorrhiza]
MESSPGKDVIVPDSTSDSSISPDKKRTKFVSHHHSRLMKGKQQVPLRAASRVTFSKNSGKVQKSSKVESDLIIIDDAPAIRPIHSSKSVEFIPHEAKSKVLSLNTRTTLASFHDALLKLNTAQKDAVRDIGFGNILELRVKELPGRLAYWALNSFNPTTCELEISTSIRVKVTENDVYRVFGIPKGFRRIKRFDRQTSSELFDDWVALFRVENRDKIKIGLVVNEMLKCKTGGTWFKRHFMIAMCFSIFESFSNGTVHPHVLNTLVDVDKLAEWDWAEYMVRSLIENRKTWGGDETKMYTGPSIFLVLFYVDRINISGTISKRVFPILMSWSSSDLRERQRIEKDKPKFGIGRLCEPLTLPARYGVKFDNSAKCEKQIEVVEDYIISKKLREDAKFIAKRMAQLNIVANSASIKEKGSKFFKDSVEEVFKLTGVRIVIDTPDKLKQAPVTVDLEDDITMRCQLHSKRPLRQPSKVLYRRIAFAIDNDVLNQVNFNAAKIANKENQVFCTPSKTVVAKYLT